MTRQEASRSDERAESKEVCPVAVECVGSSVYRISGPKEALLALGYKLYTALGGSELSSDQCASLLERDNELRPRSGIFAISFARGTTLVVQNRNLQGDAVMDALLKRAVEQETQ